MPTKSAPRKKGKMGRPAAIDRGVLLDAAERLFSERGFDGATTRELAKLADCNIALISYYFGGKEGLYKAVLQRHFDRKLARHAGPRPTDAELARAWPELALPEQRQLCAVIYDLSQGLTSSSPMQRILCREMLTGATQITAILSRSEGSAFLILEQRLKEFQAQGLMRKGFNLKIAVVGLFGPLVYSCVAAPILKEVYGIPDVNADYMRALCVHQTRVFFESAAPVKRRTRKR